MIGGWLMIDGSIHTMPVLLPTLPFCDPFDEPFFEPLAALVEAFFFVEVFFFVDAFLPLMFMLGLGYLATYAQ
jgi:hypothetical protein